MEETTFLPLYALLLSARNIFRSFTVTNIHCEVHYVWGIQVKK